MLGNNAIARVFEHCGLMTDLGLIEIHDMRFSISTCIMKCEAYVVEVVSYDIGALKEGFPFLSTLFSYGGDDDKRRWRR